MYSDLEVYLQMVQDERMRRKGVPFLEYAGATESAADLSRNYHALDGLPQGQPILCQDAMGNLQTLPGLHYPITGGN